MQIKIKLIGAFLYVLLMSGCSFTPEFTVEVDAIGELKADNRSYFIAATDQSSKDKLQFLEYADLINSALKKQGFVEVHNPQKASIAIAFKYFTTGPHKGQYQTTTPVYGNTVTSYYNSKTKRMNYMPGYGIVGNRPITVDYTYYLHGMKLGAFKNDKDVDSDELWKLTATNISTSSNLRAIFPYLLASAEPYLGKSTGQKIEVTLKEDDPRILALKNTASPQQNASSQVPTNSANNAPYGNSEELTLALEQFTLGHNYEYGIGVKKNKAQSKACYRKSIDLFRKLAEQGNAKAQYELGNAYTDGKGVSKNKVKATDWYRKAAEDPDQIGSLAKSALTRLLH